MLLDRRPDPFDSDDLVFKTRQGNAIDDHNFRNRAWATILKRLNIPYRKPYNTRHTAISHSIKQLPPTAVAEMTGHDVKTLYQHYAGSVESSPVMPDLLE